MTALETYPVTVAGVTRHLRLFQIKPGVRIAILNILGDTEETLSITTGAPQTLYLDEKDRGLVEGRKVVILDDVISTGSTLQGMRLILGKAGAEVIGEAAIFTEGDRATWQNIIALGHLPVWVD